jgi:hypothetical protein
MKLKKSSEPEMVAPAPMTGRAAIADRFKLDLDSNVGRDPNGVGKTGAMIALVGSLVVIAVMSVVTWLLYMNWELIRDV